MATCSSCGAAIEWARTELGKLMPMDEAEVEGGNYVVIKGVARPRNSEDVRLLRPPRQSHFASCPQAAKHRRKP